MSSFDVIARGAEAVVDAAFFLKRNMGRMDFNWSSVGDVLQRELIGSPSDDLEALQLWSGTKMIAGDQRLASLGIAIVDAHSESIVAIDLKVASNSGVLKNATGNSVILDKEGMSEPLRMLQRQPKKTR